MFFFSLSGHEYYDGSCPEFTSMEGFDWSRFTGDWWTILKMNTRSSCMRYSYGVDDGERYVKIHVSNLTLQQWGLFDVAFVGLGGMLCRSFKLPENS